MTPETTQEKGQVASLALGTGSAFSTLIAAINALNREEWDEIERRTVDRLLATEFCNEDTRSNRVSCRSIVTNALQDIAMKP